MQQYEQLALLQMDPETQGIAALGGKKTRTNPTHTILREASVARERNPGISEVERYQLRQIDVYGLAEWSPERKEDWIARVTDPSNKSFPMSVRRENEARIRMLKELEVAVTENGIIQGDPRLYPFKGITVGCFSTKDPLTHLACSYSREGVLFRYREDLVTGGSSQAAAEYVAKKYSSA